MPHDLITTIKPDGFKDLGLAPEVFLAMSANNKARLVEVRSQTSPTMMTVFDLVPDILNGRPVGPPEYLAAGRTPTGLRFWGSPGEESGERNPAPALESLMLMGSSGSIGHTARSDLDYWLCYNPDALPAASLDFFRRQLDLLTVWAAREYGTEINFYLVDLINLSSGKMIGSGGAQDAEGQTAPLLLLEEFYRTSLHLGGRLPLWWSVRPEITASEYDRLAENLNRAAPGGLAAFLVNLGFPGVPRPQEYLAAALWLSRKSEADPFKGVIKLMIILEQVETSFKAPPLCRQLKERVLKTPIERLPVDPYLLTITNVLSYGQIRLQPDQLELLRISVFFKVRGLGRPGRRVALSPRSQKYKILTALIKAWGWKTGQLERLDGYECWPERAQLDLGERLQDLSSELYSYIDHRLDADYPGQVDAQRGRLNQLAARLLTRQKGYEATVETLPSQLHRSAIPSNLLLARSQDGWGLYASPAAGEGRKADDSLIYHSFRVARVAAWLVNNRLSDFHLEIAPGPVPADVFSRLTNEIAKLWPPIKWDELNPENIWRPGAQGPRLIIVNLENTCQSGNLKEIDLIFRTGWGEMRHLWLDLSRESLEADKYKQAAELVEQAGGEIDPEGLQIFLTGEIPGAGKMTSNLKAAVTMTLQKEARQKRVPAADSRIRLDLS